MRGGVPWGRLGIHHLVAFINFAIAKAHQARACTFKELPYLWLRVAIDPCFLSSE